MRKLLYYLKGYERETVLAPLFKMLEALFELFVPLVMAAVIDRGIAGQDRPYIVRMCLLLVVLGVIGLVCSITAQYFAAKAATGFSTRLRHALFAHIQGLSYTELDQMGTSTLITRMTSDINQVQSGVNLVLRLFLRSPFIVFGAMIMAFTVDVRAALVFVVAIPLLSLVVFGIMLFTMPLYKRVQGALDRVLGLTRENLTGVRVIRAFNKEQEEWESYREKNEALTGLQKFVGGISGLMNPLTYVIVNVSIIALLYAGALRVDSGALTQGQVVALVNYMSQILVELVKLANLIITVTKAIACGNRVESVLEQKNSMSTGRKAAADKSGAPEEGCVVFDRVGLTYAGAGSASLTGISFSAKKGETVGIIGGTGSGKTSLVNLIPRFYDVTEGAVYVNGKDVREQEPERLRSGIGIVPQKAELFAGTIADNLRWGKRDAADSELWEALELSQAREFVEKKPEGLASVVAQGGKNLSGGQRQRLTIARALVRKPSILILDDSASALDFATDAALRRALGGMEDRPTTFIVSQRTSSIRHADRILVLEDGRMAGLGTHQELLESCPVYQEIYYSQFEKKAAPSGAAEGRR
ncbi:MAG: ABC transporter ATP-binding protein [Eubacteriales bacterium]|nr:ABC transporter ATP-binding protein [Eubacteriales bacterium]